MAILFTVKDPQEILTYTLNWATEMGSDTISGTPVWTVPTGLTKQSQSNTTTTASITLSSGTEGARYQVLCHVVGSSGQEYERTLWVKAEHK